MPCSMTCSPTSRSRSSAPTVTRSSRDPAEPVQSGHLKVSPLRSNCMTKSNLGLEAFEPVAMSRWISRSAASVRLSASI